MPIYQVNDKKTIAPLFYGWEQTMIWSCLQDCMGVAYARPSSAQIVVGPFCFFAGNVNYDLVKNNLNFSFDMIPQNSLWEEAIEFVYGDRVKRQVRYATKKEPEVFDVLMLRKIVESLTPPYEIKAIDHALYEQIIKYDWAEDLCANFENADSFVTNGLGFVIIKDDEIVSGASSFTFYRGGIEIEIDTREDERRKGLALTCGAKLILECLDRNLYPSWDAHNKGSLALAEKLGYRFDKEYPTYEFV